MESPKFTTYLRCLCMLLLCAATLNPAFPLKNCTFPAIFNFGDSNSDTGGLSASLITPKPPYGETYFTNLLEGSRMAGSLSISWVSKSLGLPYLSAYLDSLGTNFTHGANFATAASTIRLPINIIPRGGFSPFYLNIQYSQFGQFKNRSQIIRQKGAVFANLMPKGDYFSKALYTFDIGQNDHSEGFFNNMTIEEVNASVPDIVNKFSTNVKNIYNLGARSFWIHNTEPIGCLPYILANFQSAQRDSYGCAKPYNDEAIVQLRKDLPLAAITHVDVYSVKYSLFSKPKEYGFELPLIACCGYGGIYNYGSGICGQTITINGSQIFVGSCERPSIRVNWDGVHYTEAANKFIFDQISTGLFSDPPTPLKMARHNI
ncbi:esterase-like isoform X1 [Fagus crenata]